MGCMSDLAPHHFTFTVEAPRGLEFSTVAAVRRIGAVAHSCAEAEAAVRAYAISDSRIYLHSIERIGEGCADERCQVCHPSSRNAGL